MINDGSAIREVTNRIESNTPLTDLVRNFAPRAPPELTLIDCPLFKGFI
jgi:hypothetical protein